MRGWRIVAPLAVAGLLLMILFRVRGGACGI